MAYYVIDGPEFVGTLVHALAKRLHDKKEWPDMSRLPMELMELVLRCHELDVLKFEKIAKFIDKYLKTREKKFSDKIPLRRVKQLKNLGVQLQRLREYHLQAKNMFELQPDERRIAPLQLMKELNEEFYKQLKGSELERFEFQLPSHLDIDVLTTKLVVPVLTVDDDEVSPFQFTKSHIGPFMSTTCAESHSTSSAASSSSGDWLSTSTVGSLSNSLASSRSATSLAKLSSSNSKEELAPKMPKPSKSAETLVALKQATSSLKELILSGLRSPDVLQSNSDVRTSTNEQTVMTPTNIRMDLQVKSQQQPTQMIEPPVIPVPANIAEPIVMPSVIIEPVQQQESKLETHDVKQSEPRLPLAPVVEPAPRSHTHHHHKKTGPKPVVRKARILVDTATNSS
jgi:hypothetical protein